MLWLSAIKDAVHHTHESVVVRIPRGRAATDRGESCRAPLSALLAIFKGRQYGKRIGLILLHRIKICVLH